MCSSDLFPSHDRKAWDLISRLSNVVPFFQTKIDEIELTEAVVVVVEGCVVWLVGWVKC